MTSDFCQQAANLFGDARRFARVEDAPHVDQRQPPPPGRGRGMGGLNIWSQDPPYCLYTSTFAALPSKGVSRSVASFFMVVSCSAISSREVEPPENMVRRLSSNSFCTA
jgi:hypothetical protein